MYLMIVITYLQANVYMYNDVADLFDADLTKIQNLTNWSVIVGFGGVKLEHEYNDETTLKISVSNDSTIMVLPRLNHNYQLIISILTLLL